MIRLGLRLTLQSGREPMLRVLVTAAAVALGVGLLLAALAGEPHVCSICVLLSGAVAVTASRQDAYDGPLSAIRNHVNDVATWLAIWSAHSEPDAHARRRAGDAVNGVAAGPQARAARVRRAPAAGQVRLGEYGGVGPVQGADVGALARVVRREGAPVARDRARGRVARLRLEAWHGLFCCWT